MTFLNRHYPSFFPNDCPPPEAKHEKKRVYRLIEGCAVTENDFKSYVELKKNFNPTRNPKYGEYAISVNTDIKELRKSFHSVPSLRKKFKYIAVGETYICTGVICHDKSKNQASHHDWWLYEEASPDKYFKIIEKVV